MRQFPVTPLEPFVVEALDRYQVYGVAYHTTSQFCP